MERREKLEELSREFFCSRFPESLSILEQEYQRNQKKLHLTFVQVFQEVCRKARKAQAQGSQGKIAFFAISYLASSRITGSFQFQLALYDKRFYLDSSESFAYWCPEFLFSFYQKNMELLSCYLEARVPRLRNHELDWIGREYYKDYEALAMELFRGLCREILKEKENASLEWEEEARIVYGGFQDAFYILYPEDGEEKRYEIFSDLLG